MHVSLNLEYPFTSNWNLIRRQNSENQSMISFKSFYFSSHNSLPLRILGSLSIGGGFSGNGNGKSESFRAEER